MFSFGKPYPKKKDYNKYTNSHKMDPLYFRSVKRQTLQRDCNNTVS